MEWKKYIFTFLITAAIFMTAIWASNYFNQKKINEIKDIESQIAIDISASETQFSLLAELPCSDITGSPLSQELATLGDKLSYMEESRGSDDSEVVSLKKYYSLLQIKDFLLIQKIKEKCGTNTTKSGPFVVYFYSNEGNCTDCQKEGFVLTKLRADYPELRVYAFDYNLNLSALQTLISIYNIKNEQPTLLVDGKVYYGYKSLEDVKSLLPALAKIDKQKATDEALKAKQATTTKK
jgi:hypothetical protein